MEFRPARAIYPVVTVFTRVWRTRARSWASARSESIRRNHRRPLGRHHVEIRARAVPAPQFDQGVDRGFVDTPVGDQTVGAIEQALEVRPCFGIRQPEQSSRRLENLRCKPPATMSPAVSITASTNRFRASTAVASSAGSAAMTVPR